MHHSDRGSTYAAYEYQARLTEVAAVCSMSRKGDCYDNAAMESFFHTLKTELVYLQKFSSKREAKMAIFEYIEAFF